MDFIKKQENGKTLFNTNIINSLFKPENCSYVSCYCEENVYKLCEDVTKKYPGEIHKCSVVFVSNQKRKVPLWKQRAGREEDKLVIWDYHVIFLYHPEPQKCLVYDLDSELPFPTYFHKYVIETFRTDQILKSDYFRYFRVIPGEIFLENFASDRRHMKRDDGTWIKPPPNYDPIATTATTHNLEEFIEMDPNKGFGEVLNLTQFVQRFYKTAT